MRRLGLVVFAAIAVTLSACGSGTSSTAAPAHLSAVALIAGSADKAAEAKTARMSGQVTIQTGGQAKTLPLDGAVDFGNGAFAFTYDMSQLGLPGGAGAKIQARLVDGVMYMNLGDLTGDAGRGLSSMLHGKTWVKIDFSTLGAGAAGSGGLSDANPGGTLDMLRGAGNVQTIGSEEIRGVETTHYRATVDAQKAIDKAPAALRDRVEQSVDALGGSIPVDVWLDGDGQTRKVTVDMSTKVGRIATSMEYYDFGTAVSVPAPPASDTVDFSEMLGGLGRLSGAGTAAA